MLYEKETLLSFRHLFRNVRMITFSLCLKVLFLTLYPQNVHATECQSRNFPFEVRFEKSCEFHIHEKCNVTCEHKGIVYFKQQVRCLENGEWSPLPMCKRILHSRGVKFLDCSKLPMNLRKNTICMKFSIPQYMCPEIVQLQIDLKNCTRKPNSYCIISCGNTFTNLTCLPNGKWSHLPMCKFSKENVCPELKIGTLVNCTRREGERCEIRCPGGKIMNKDVICSASGEWIFTTTKHTSSPLSHKPLEWEIISNCHCPSPNLTTEIETTENCRNKKIGEKCHLKCHPHYSIIGKKVITCHENGSWSELPICSKKTCPPPVLPNELLFKENCSAKQSGEKCKVACRSQFQRFKKNSLTCINGTHWTKFPTCACFPPNLPEGMTTAENCEKKKIGRACHLKCQGNYSIIGLNVISCQSDGSWTALPECRKNICSKPKLPKPLIFSEDCKSKRVGEVCQLECLNTEEMHEIRCLNHTFWSSFPKCSCPKPSFSERIKVREDCSQKKPGDKCKVSCTGTTTSRKRLYITCQNNSQWSEEPSCKREFCPLPSLPPYLVFEEDCSYKSRGEQCKLNCKTGGKIFEKDYIKCLKGKRWTHFPVCGCPFPNIPGDIEVMEDCNNKTSGENCKVKCKNELNTSNVQIMFCNTDLTWTPQPSCLKKYCTEPVLPQFLLLKNNCSSKSIGEKCEVFCKEGGEIAGERFLICLSALKWSPFPSCTCPSPSNTYNFLLTENCKYKKPGEECKLTCRNGLKLQGSDTIRCLESFKWSSLPKCNSLCSTPKLPEILDVVGQCFDKEPGNICNVSCKEGGKIVGNPYITCLNEIEWTPAPKCTCPNPLLKNNLKSLSDCSYKLPGENCNLMCEIKAKLIGPSFITCGNDTRWSNQPSCDFVSCPEPKLSQILKFNEDCSSKQPGESCKVTCKEGGNILGENSVKCFENLTWSAIPSCSCPKPNLQNDLEFSATSLDLCNNKSIGQKCLLKCKEAFSNISFPYITCMNDTKWSNQPNCKKNFCREPTLPSFLNSNDICTFKVPGDECLVSCRDSGVIIGNSKIKCLNITHWSKFPDCRCPEPYLDEDLETVNNCTLKKVQDRCNLQCKDNKKLIGDSFITCKKNFRWSTLPVCRLQVCNYPLPVRGILEQKDDCFSVTVGNTCSVKCSEGGKIIGSDTIKCLNSTHWEKLPDCTCPKPDLPDYLKFDENGECSNKRRGNRCKISCRKFQKLIGDVYIKCQENTRWSSLPRCENIVCPKPVFSGSILTSVGDCSSKAPNETCELRCKGDGKILGNSFITCINGTKWSDFPDCSCPPPSLHRELTLLENNCDSKKVGETCGVACKTSGKKATIICQNSRKWSDLPICETVFCPVLMLPKEVYITTGDCHSKVQGEKCYLRCTQGGTIKGRNFLECQKDGFWSKEPECSCPKPDLGQNLYTLESGGCTLKSRGEKCKLFCKNDKKITGEGSITCQNNTQWSLLPRCEEQFCPKPTLPPTLKLENDCNSKLPNQTCQLSCSEGGTIIGEKVLTCLNNLTWSQFPVCTCPEPILRLDLKSFNCKDISPGKKCFIFCKNRYASLKENFITCTTETKWSSQPQCEKAKCNDIKFPSNSNYEGTCSDKSAGDICNIRCKGGGSFVDNQDHITCNRDGKWSKPRRCFCPPLIPPDEYILKEDDCSKKLPGENCLIGCKNGGNLEGKNYIECDNSSRWVAFPPCKLNICQDPLLPQGVTVLENCRNKKSGESCRLSCQNGGILMGPNEIFCKPDRTWSLLPICTCPIPPLPLGAEYLENCEGKRIGEFCSVSCKTMTKQPTPHAVTCLMESNGMWSAPPECTCSYPTHLFKYVKLEDKCEGVTSFPVGSICRVYCENRGTMFNGSAITCLEKDIWSISPFCSCAPPPPQDNVNYSNCSQTLPGTSCQVSCFKGRIDKTSLTCSRTYTWEKFPQCTVISCSVITFTDPLIGLNCTDLFADDICEVGCKNGARLVGSKLLKCVRESNYEWIGGNQPHCICTPPEETQEYRISELGKCDMKKFREQCSISCRSVNVHSYIRCIMEKDRMWTGFPECSIACFSPVATYRNQKKMHAVCSKPSAPYAEGDSCTLQCLREGTVIKDNTIRCRKNGTWEGNPMCSCPLPPPNDDFEPIEDCSRKFDRQTCALRCRKPGFTINPTRNSLTCNSIAGLWTGSPACDPTAINRGFICPPPQISDPLTEIKEDCNRKSEGQTCQLGCRNNAPFINTSISSITCMRGVWSAAPVCACTSVKSFENWIIHPPGSCDTKRPNEMCYIFCNQEKKYVQIKCLPNGAWTMPNCQDARVRRLTKKHQRTTT